MLPATFLRVLAGAFLVGNPAEDQLVSRVARTLGQRYRWIAPLARRYIRATAGQTRPRRYDVVRFLQNDRGFQRASSKHREELAIAQWLAEPDQMQPVAVAAGWSLPVLESPGELADWLGVSIDDLRWFADLKGLGRKRGSSRLGHYHYRVLTKQSGQVRLIEAPKHRLKDVQRQILFNLLDKIPPHAASHGFVKERSIKTFVAPHVGKRVVLRMDLQDFFPKIRRPRIQAFFRTVGYPEKVADLAAGVCTTTTPPGVWREIANSTDARALYSQPHLPQGAPTSPALANLCCYRLDCRLAALAEAAGGSYSRYADDLAFSGPESFVRMAQRFSVRAAAIVKEEGFTVHHRKTRIMRQSVRQHLAGLVTNSRINVRRIDFDKLKAILNNCVHSGPESQNREGHPHFRSHLLGRVAFVESVNPAKGNKLRAIFGRIQWQ